MALRCRHLRETSRLLLQSFSGDSCQHCRTAINILALSRILQSQALERTDRLKHREFQSKRFFSVAGVPKKFTADLELLPFIISTLDKHKGPNHCWLNKHERSEKLLKKDGLFLVLAGQFLEMSLSTGSETVNIVEKIKLLQQRFSQLQIVGFQSSSLLDSAADRSNLVHFILKEYITFPILLSDKNFLEVENGSYYILFKDVKNPTFYQVGDLDFEVLYKAIEELHLQHKADSSSADLFISTFMKQTDVIKEPSLHYLQNLLFYFPGCITADEGGSRLFLSDSNHHRVIILNVNGKILDCIGSSPGFEDGAFESAKLLRPAASFYDAAEDYLYFVDSENHAIRRADMERRVVETIFPACYTKKKTNKIWTWIMDTLGFGSDADTKPEEFDSQPLLFPWHLLNSEDGCLLVINRSFDTLWIIDLASSEVKEIIKGLPKIMEICGQQISEKLSLLKDMPHDWLQEQVNITYSPEGLPYAGLLSSLTTSPNHLIICDTVGQRILKLSGESRVPLSFQFSNFGILGLPYWLSPRLERVFTLRNGLHGAQIDHAQCFRPLPGKIDIQLNIIIPVDTELVEQLEDGCIWCQARGAATEVSGVEDLTGSTEKVGVAQQWYDELDNLAFSTPELELTVEETDATLETISQDKRVHMNVVVNASPGTSEVIVNAVLYLKLKRYLENNQEKSAGRILDILNSERRDKFERESCIQLLLKSKTDLRDLIFMKPVCVKIQLDCLNHPKAADNSKEIVLTDSSIEVIVSL